MNGYIWDRLKRIFLLCLACILFSGTVQASELMYEGYEPVKPYRVVDLRQAKAIPKWFEFADYSELDSLSRDTEEYGELFFCVYKEELDAVYDTVIGALSNADVSGGAFVTARGVLWTSEFPQEKPLKPILNEGAYYIYQNKQLLKRMNHYYEAVEYARLWRSSYIAGEMIIAQDFPAVKPGFLHTVESFEAFDNLVDAVSYARDRENHAVISAVSGEFDISDCLWISTTPEGQARIEGVPFISQGPELMRGCEVTSLAMLLNFKGIAADKMALAEEVKKSPERYDDPNNGFIGSMYTYDKHGLGVYHSPIAELMQAYMPRNVIDITGCEFEDLYYYLDRGEPVWIITNSRYRVLPAGEFVTWNTPSGPIKITYREHPVLVVGYDEKYIYYNDPLSGGYRRAQLSGFVGAWEQIGRQAITAVPGK